MQPCLYLAWEKYILPQLKTFVQILWVRYKLIIFIHPLNSSTSATLLASTSACCHDILMLMTDRMSSFSQYVPSDNPSQLLLQSRVPLINSFDYQLKLAPSRVPRLTCIWSKWVGEPDYGGQDVWRVCNVKPRQKKFLSFELCLTWSFLETNMSKQLFCRLSDPS